MYIDFEKRILYCLCFVDINIGCMGEDSVTYVHVVTLLNILDINKQRAVQFLAATNYSRVLLEQ